MCKMKYYLISAFFSKLCIITLFFITQILCAQTTIEKRDAHTAESVIYEEVKNFADGSPMTRAKTDGVIYIAENNRFYRRLISEHINIKWFGAKGDGDRNDLGTDDTKPIEAALKTLETIYKGYDLSGGNLFGGFTLYFPGGKYLINKTLVLPNNIVVKGESPYSSVIHTKKPGFIFTNIAGFNPNGIDVIMNHNISIKNITLKQGGIEFQQAVSSRIENVRILNLSGRGTDTGISVKLSVDLRIRDVKIVGSSGYGIFFREDVGGRASTTTSFENVWVAHCQIGMLVDGSDGNYGIVSSNISNSIFEYNKTGLQIKGRVANFSLRDIHFEQNSANAVEIDGDINVVMENIWGDQVGEMKVRQTGKQNRNSKIYLRNFNIPYKVDNSFKGQVLSNE